LAARIDELDASLRDADAKKEAVATLRAEISEFREHAAAAAADSERAVALARGERDAAVADLETTRAAAANAGGSGGSGGGSGGAAGGDSGDERVALVMRNLQRKCEQLTETQLELRSHEQRLATRDDELKAAHAKEVEYRAFLRTNMELKRKLTASEKMCRKLLDSGLYWRQRRRKTARQAAQRVIVPMRGGGGGGGGGGGSRNDSPTKAGAADAGITE
jgi:hypothetical protein